MNPTLSLMRGGLGLLGSVTGFALGNSAHSALAGHPTVNPDNYPDYGGKASCHSWYMMCRWQWWDRDHLPGPPEQFSLELRTIYQPVDPDTGMDHTADNLGWFKDAEDVWSDSHGPQNFKSGDPNAGWNYLKFSIDQERDGHLIGEDSFGVTYNCNEFFATICSAAMRPIDIQWSEIYIDPVEVYELDITKKNFLFAHEMGHTLGLGHHQGNYLMNGGGFKNIYAPTETDLGSTTDCREGSVERENFGIRCIYGWYPTPPPGGGSGGRGASGSSCIVNEFGQFKCPPTS